MNYQDISSERLIKMYAQDCDLYRTTLLLVLDALVSHFNKDWAVDVLIANIKGTLKNTSKPPEDYNFEEESEEIPF